MNGKIQNEVLITFILLSLLAAPALGVSVSCSTGGGGGSVSSSTNYKLDAFTSLQEQTTLGSGQIFQERQANGKGDNSLSQHVTGNGYSTDNAVDSSGSLSTSTTTAASATSVSVNQNVAGSGSVSTSVSGNAASGQSGQQAGVTEGSIATAQNIAAASSRGVAASQSTAIAGEMGSLSSISSSDENTNAITGGFSGQGDMQAELITAATNRAMTAGSASIVGVPALDNSYLDKVASGNVQMSVDGLYLAGDERIGQFDLNAVNIEKNSGSGSTVYGLYIPTINIPTINIPTINIPTINPPTTTNPPKTNPPTTTNPPTGIPPINIPTINIPTINIPTINPPTTTTTNPPTGLPGNPNSYVLEGWKLNNPNFQLVVKSDGYMPTGLSVSGVQSAATAATQTWNKAVPKKPFADPTPVTSMSGVSADVHDGKNVVAFIPFSSSMASALAYTRTFYSSGSAIEADVNFNANDKWSLSAPTSFGSSGPFDFQSVATHEFGHIIGLGDLYNLPSTDSRRSDHSAIMNSYNDPQRTLGAGDANGAWQLYH